MGRAEICMFHFVNGNFESKLFKKIVFQVLSYYLDAPISSLDLGAFHISQVLRRTESQYSKFKRRSIFMNHLQYLNLDIFLVILVILFIVSKF